MTGKLAVWLFLPGQAEPVPCGRLVYRRTRFIEFSYQRSYLDRKGAVALHPNTLALGLVPYVGPRVHALPHAISDAAPDAWGRRVIEYHHGSPAPDELDYLREGLGHRTGALHFQTDESLYAPPDIRACKFEDLAEAARLLETNAPLPPELVDALQHGSSIGGARPKAAVFDESGHWIAKFSSTNDRQDIVRFEYAAYRLAARCGIVVPETRLVEVANKHALLVRRFDRPKSQTGGYTRRLLLSALSLLELDDTEARLAGYPDFAEVLRQWSRDARRDTEELFRRMIFNMLIGNTDDHAKNHACFWDGRRLDLTPAYDIVPMPRVGQEGRQAMRVGERGPEASLSNAYSEVARFGILDDEARALVARVLEQFEGWRDEFRQAGVPAREIDRFASTVIGSEAVLR